jgi:hypothetical protein
MKDYKNKDERQKQICTETKEIENLKDRIEKIEKVAAEKGNTKALNELDKLNESLSKVQAICILGDEKHDAEKHDTLDYIIEGVEKVAVEIAGIDNKVKEY